MTVDMLAATFFWPEGTLLGAQGLSAHHGQPAEAAGDATPTEEPSEVADAAADGFWATVARNLWRPAGGSSTGAVG